MHEVDLGIYRPLDDEQIFYFHRFPWAEAARAAPSIDSVLERGVRFLRSKCPASPLSLETLAQVLEQVFDTEREATGAQFSKYSVWGQIFSDPWFTFMNYGYKDLDGDERLEELRPSLSENERLFLTAAQLYLRTASFAEMAGRDVLEVGSGRGGGAALVHRLMRSRRYLGLDGTRTNVEFARAVHSVENLEFAHGRAESFDVGDATFDVVLNIESCTYYEPFSAFVTEARRVLRPGGVLCIAWFEPEEAMWRRCDEIESNGFEPVGIEDVTTNVRESLRDARGGLAVLEKVETRLRKKVYYDAFGAIYDPGVVLPQGVRYVTCGFRRT